MNQQLQLPVNPPPKHVLPAAGRTEPNLALCRARHAGFGDYVDCLVKHPERCRYALAFGEGHLCLHPERHQIVAHTITWVD